jgi:hypothetical protein
MASLKKVYKLLEKLNHLVRIDKTDTGLVLTYSDKVIGYEITPDGFRAEKEYKLPKWAVRIGIMCHIIRFCKRHLYKTDVIAYYNSEGQVNSLAEIVEFDGDFKEDLLCTLIHDGIENEFSQIHFTEAEEYGVLNEFKILLEILES